MFKFASRIAVACVLAFSLNAQAQETTTTADGAEVGPMGLSFFGFRGITFDTTPGTPGGEESFGTDVIGLRYWLGPASTEGFIKRMGVDAGVGLLLNGGSIESEAGGVTTSADNPSTSGFGLHGGFPLVLGMFRHANFQVIPELDFVYLSQTEEGDPEISNSLTGLTLGARAGFEVFFGFIGIPQLSLEATMGLAFGFTDLSSESQPAAGQASTSSQTDWFFATQKFNDPWDIFRGNVAARYYF